MKINYLLFVGLLSPIALLAQKTSKTDTLKKYYELQEINIMGKKANNGAINKIDAKQIRDFNKTNIVDAVNLLPGVSITQFGARNEGSILLRGFNALRTPIFYDGIPIYTPYDGNFDLARFTTFDTQGISVEKNLVSVQYGPNTMGGAVNIISKKPIKKLDLDGQAGLAFADGTGVNTFFTAFNVGTRQKKYYALASASILKSDDFNLSKKFETTTLQPTLTRVNSAASDARLGAKVGYTPNTTDEYSLNVMTQYSEKNISPNTINAGNSNWRDYPTYNKTSVYLKTKTLVVPKSFLNFTTYYDTYFNKMGQFDDEAFILMNKNSSFMSIYDDSSLGGILSFTTQIIKNNVITISINNKFDYHKEYNGEIPANTKTGQRLKAGEPIQKYKDNTFFIGFEDVISINKYLKVVAGASYNSRNNIIAQEYGTHYTTGQKDVLYDFPKGADNAVDFKTGVIFEPSINHLITLSVSKRSRFASQKERYSSRFGSQVPNPDLKSEYTWAYDISYTAKAGLQFNYEISAFANTIQNAIFARTVGTLDNGNPISQNVNIGKAIFTGYELALGYSPLQNLKFGANYSYINTKDKTTGSNEKFVGIPNHKIVAYGNIEIPKLKSGLNFNVEYYGKRYITSAGAQSPQFTLVNAKLFAHVTKRVSINFGVRNLLDKNYYLAIGYPKEGRSFISSLSYQF